MNAQLLDLGVVPYQEAWDLQRSIAAEVHAGRAPDTILLLEHPPVVTLGRRAEQGELHLPPGAAVEIVETDRGGRSTYHAPGQLVCYPILDLTRHGQDVKRYCRDLEEALIRTTAALGVESTRIDGLTGIWLEHATRSRVTRDERGRSPSASAAQDWKRAPYPAKIASIGVHISKWVATHGYALNVDLDPAPFTEWITACGLEDAAFTTLARELGRPVTLDEVKPHAARALADVFQLSFPSDEGSSLDERGMARPEDRVKTA